MLIITGHIYLEPSELASFLADLKTLSTPTRLRAGNVAYHSAVEDADEGQVLVWECWADQASLSAHLEAADTLAFVSRWHYRMQADIRKYDASNERPLAAM
jgi:quinol monooxygenase YgiN